MFLQQSPGGSFPCSSNASPACLLGTGLGNLPWEPVEPSLRAVRASLGSGSSGSTNRSGGSGMAGAEPTHLHMWAGKFSRSGSPQLEPLPRDQRGSLPTGLSRGIREGQSLCNLEAIVQWDEYIPRLKSPSQRWWRGWKISHSREQLLSVPETPASGQLSAQSQEGIFCWEAAAPAPGSSCH